MDDSTTSKPNAVFDPQTVAGRAFVRDLQHAHRSMRGATDATALQQAAAEIQALVHGAVGQAPEPLTRFISTLNDTLTRRVIELTCAGTQIRGVRWCWIALGSEGRQEQTLASDQDNGIIFASIGDATTLREHLLPMALRINEALDACGFPLCTGQVMASNPQWCLDLHEWRQRFATWIIEGDPQALLNASIFFDLRPLYGANDLAQMLTDWLGENAPDNPRFLLQMTENALRRKAPLGVLRDFVVEQGGEYAGTIDLKLHAATLFVDAARIYGLARGARATNTADRLRLAGGEQRLNQRDVEAWIQAFYFIQMLRLKNQQRCYERGSVMHNHVNPNELDAAERRALLDALRRARELQKRLALDYLGTHQGL
jgi:CBS domain-containing protein